MYSRVALILPAPYDDEDRLFPSVPVKISVPSVLLRTPEAGKRYNH